VFPTVSWIADRPAPLNLEDWQFTVAGAVARPSNYRYGQLAEMAMDEETAVLDCTGGWYSEQRWRGVGVGRLLAAAGPAGNAASVTFRSVTGYKRRFSLDEAQRFILALEVGDSALSHGHGFPVRLVAPGYRGYDWVKWVERVEVNRSGPDLQSPLPLQ
jgi:DMSO/TMAO reductase YedYZ molybdopterin-dependent catalytic subunit